MTRLGHLLAVLARAGVEYILVGGAAATAHGSARLTSDVDVVYRRTSANLERLARALAPYNPYLRGAPEGLPFVLDTRPLLQGLNFTHKTTIGDVDLLGEIAGGGGYDALLPHTVELSAFGHACRCIDLPTLIRVKRAAGRLKNLESIAELESLLDER
jgi:hypothetical protein